MRENGYARGWPERIWRGTGRRARALLRTLFALGGIWAAGPVSGGALREYVEREDGSCRFERVAETDLGSSTAHTLALTSQTWREIEWKHWLTVLVPGEIRHPGQAVLVVAGGSNRDDPPSGDVPEARLIGSLTAQLGVPVAVLQQVPNQPLFDSLYEDALIAKTFEGFLREGDEDWPLLLPMTKSAVRAMDAVGEFMESEFGRRTERFAVAGASKRGWTTYLTAAVDDRVEAIVPIVIDMLNLVPQMRQQRQSYGKYSRRIADYSERGLIEKLETEAGRRLVEIVDPYEYRERLTMPGLVVLGTNDPFWTVDAAGLYFGDLPGPKYLHYGANAGHGVEPSSYPTLLGFLERVLSDRPMPELEWERDGENGLRVGWDGEPGARAFLYEARSDNRDFREARWRSHPLENDGTGVTVPLNSPDNGWAAYYVEVVFPASPPNRLPVHLSTEITVLPEAFPYEDDGPPAR